MQRTVLKNETKSPLRSLISRLPSGEEILEIRESWQWHNEAKKRLKIFLLYAQGHLVCRALDFKGLAENGAGGKR